MAIFSLSGVPAIMVLMPLFGLHFGGSGTRRSDLRVPERRLGIWSPDRRDPPGDAAERCSGLGRLIGLSSFIFTPWRWRRSRFPHHSPLSLIIIPFAGWGMITNFAAANTILQTLVDDDKRGRVMSFLAMSFMGMTPFGVLIVGGLASRFSNDPFRRGASGRCC